MEKERPAVETRLWNSFGLKCTTWLNTDKEGRPYPAITVSKSWKTDEGWQERKLPINYNQIPILIATLQQHYADVSAHMQVAQKEHSGETNGVATQQYTATKETFDDEELPF